MSAVSGLCCRFLGQWRLLASYSTYQVLNLSRRLLQCSSADSVQVHAACMKLCATPLACCHAGIVTGQLRLDAGTLAGIYQCSISSWDDPAITALNPNLS